MCPLLLKASTIPPSLSAEELASSDQVTTFLVKNGADLNRGDKYGLTPLHYAAMRGNELATKELLQFRGINIEVTIKSIDFALNIIVQSCIIIFDLYETN